MDSHVGLDYIVDNPDYCNKLASALDTANSSVKKQVVELLSALCVYSQDGRQRTIDTLHIYQELKNERYRLRVVVDELQNASAEDYQTALLAFVNCLIISTPILKDRIRIRNEFIGLKLLPILNDLRTESHRVPDLRVQLDVFDEQRESDEEQSFHGPPGIDLSSHLDVFYAILGQIADTPQEIPFLSILQHLLRLDPKEAASDLAWDTAETLVHRATLLENREDATKLLRSPSLQTNLCCHCRGTDQNCTVTRKSSAPAPPLPPPPPPPCPPEPPKNSPLPPPPPLPPLPPLHGPPPVEGPPPVPPPPATPRQSRGVATPRDPPDQPAPRLLPQQEIPTPRSKMKTINWNKIPNHKVIGKRNIWSLVANDHQHSPMADLDWAEMEGLFCQQVVAATPQAVSHSGSAGNDAERRRREPTEIALLDGKRSLNVNIFLKQFRSSNEDIIQLIKDGGHDDIGAEKLRGLLKILPEVDELEMLKAFDGDKSKLGNAEKFFLQLIQVPNYKLRIECMLLKEEFAANMGYLEPSINSMILAGEDLMTNKPLQEVLYMVLVAGNFLNSGGYAGNAAGVKLSSLQKLTEIRANKPGMNLIHYVALQVEKKRKDLLCFANEMNALGAATKTTVEQLNNEFNALDTKIKKIKQQIELPTTEFDIQEQMAQFIQIAEQEMAALKRDMEELEGVRCALAEFFCEDSNAFKLEECFRVFQQFCQRFQHAIAENERRRLQEEQAIARRKQREEQLVAKKRLLNNQAETPSSESVSNLMDSLLYDIQAGFPQKQFNRGDTKVRRLQNGGGVTSEEDVSVPGSPSIRRRLGSYSGNPEQHSTKEDGHSPDITPNGSLRRRRSRVPSEEDEGNLMDFLRTTGQDTARERKSWGSLDRSWARRAIGQPRRGDLLNADFSGDRERPNSPSPLVESKPFLQEEETKPTGKAWRQKIEAWLSENEKEERAGEELQRRARQLQANRRSFEDSESEGKSSTANVMTDEGYSRVYSDWRPTVEKTDVIRTMEAIEEAQPQSPQKDKSSWRKSSLNVPNSMEETDPRYLRRLRSRASTENVLAPSTLQAIREEERKKNIISSIQSPNNLENLTIYIRQPYSDPQAPQPLPSATQSQLTRKYPKRSAKNNFAEDRLASDKIGIDSDNIETPPSARRVFSPPREVRPVEREACRRERCSSQKTQAPKPTDPGDGNFDRYSAARRTRRYKKNVDSDKEGSSKNPNQHSSVECQEEKKKSPNFPAEVPEIRRNSSESNDPERPRTLNFAPEGVTTWRERFKCRNDIDEALAEIAKSGEDLQNLSESSKSRNRLRGNPVLIQPAPVIAVSNTVLSPVMQESRVRESPGVLVDKVRAVTSRERHRSMIDPSQVKEAMRVSGEACLTSHEEEMSRIDSSKQSSRFIDGGRDYSSQVKVPSQVQEALRVREACVMSHEDASKQSQRFAADANGSQLKVPSQIKLTSHEEATTRVKVPSHEDESLQRVKARNRHDLDDSNQAKYPSPNDFSQVQVTTHDDSMTRVKPCSAFGNRYIPDDSRQVKDDSTIRVKQSSTLNPDETSQNKVKQSSNFKSRFIPEINITSSALSKKNELDLNDEGFEETQSLVSETLSQGTSNYETDTHDSPRDSPTQTSTSTSSQKKPSKLQSFSAKSSFLPKRTGSLKRADQASRNEVDRSSSRSSLRSSRSSLNSSTSVKTVKNMANTHRQLGGYTSAIRALTTNLRENNNASQGLAAVTGRNSTNKGTASRGSGQSRIPASRSSSSGSSVGPAVRSVRKTNGVSSADSLKASQRKTTRSNSIGLQLQQPIQKSSNVDNKPVSATRSRLIQPRGQSHSFMRPTAASVNKGSISNLPKSIRSLGKL